MAKFDVKYFFKAVKEVVYSIKPRWTAMGYYNLISPDAEFYDDKLREYLDGLGKEVYEQCKDRRTVSDKQAWLIAYNAYNNYLKEELEKEKEKVTAIELAEAFNFTKEMRSKLTKELNRVRLSLNALGGSLAKKYEKTFNEILRQGLNSSEIREMIKQNTERNKNVNESVNAYNNRVKTLSNTFTHGISNLMNFNDAVEAGMKYFEYTGNPAPEREFCRMHYGKVYSYGEIQQMDNEQGLDVMTYCGGYNCLHRWTAVEK
jgi:methyl-accepting chemotaxis protein